MYSQYQQTKRDLVGRKIHAKDVEEEKYRYGPAAKRRRDELAQNYYARVEGFMSKRMEETSAMPEPSLDDVRHGRREDRVYAEGGRTRIPNKELGPSRVSGQVVLTERQRIEKAIKNAPRHKGPYTEPRFLLRQRERGKEISPHLRFAARTESERINEEITFRAVGGPQTPWDESSGIPSFRDVNPNKWQGGVFQSKFRKTHVAESMGAPTQGKKEYVPRPRSPYVPPNDFMANLRTKGPPISDDIYSSSLPCGRAFSSPPVRPFNPKQPNKYVQPRPPSYPNTARSMLSPDYTPRYDGHDDDDDDDRASSENSARRANGVAAARARKGGRHTGSQTARSAHVTGETARARDARKYGQRRARTRDVSHLSEQQMSSPILYTTMPDRAAFGLGLGGVSRPKSLANSTIGLSSRAYDERVQKAEDEAIGYTRTHTPSRGASHSASNGNTLRMSSNGVSVIVGGMEDTMKRESVSRSHPGVPRLSFTGLGKTMTMTQKRGSIGSQVPVATSNGLSGSASGASSARVAEDSHSARKTYWKAVSEVAFNSTRQDQYGPSPRLPQPISAEFQDGDKVDQAKKLIHLRQDAAFVC